MIDPLLDRVTAAIGMHYLIEGEVGRGGMAVVYRALDLRLNRHVAIKVLPPDLAFNTEVRTRFLREAQTAAGLSHPNIVPIYSVDERDGIVFFAMGLVRGESLAALLARAPRRSFDEVRSVLAAVADALAYAHLHGVVHRDVKPDNIIIESDTGRPVVTDFGIARAAAADSRLTITGIAVGTPTYMSPEQALGEREVDGRSDIYSLGVVGYQMLVGEPPFRAGNTPAMLMKHVSETPRPVRSVRPDAPAALATAIDRALVKHPEQRWPDAAAFRQAILSSESTPSLPDEPRMNPALASLPFAPLGELPRALAPVALADWREMRRQARRERRIERHAGQAAYDEIPLEDRVAAFRHTVVRNIVLAPALLMLNMAVGHFPWVLFVWAWMALSVLRKGASIWADGVGPFEAFGKGIRAKLRARGGQAPAETRPPTTTELASRAAPADVLAGPHGEAVRRAVADRATVQDVLSRLGPVERGMIPDVAPTVDSLVDRVVGLATTLHRLDSDVSGTSLGQLDQRLDGLRAEVSTPERDRRLSLLERQRSSLHELLARRQALAGQLESASIALQNLKLDLLKLRSAGVGASLEDVTSATQEARALSRDIGHVLSAADDVRRL